MKSFLSVLLLVSVIFLVDCHGQPKGDYEIFSDPVPDAVTYHFFLEKESTVEFRLKENMDFISVLDLKVGQSVNPTFDVQLDNDGSHYAVGVVAENSAGYYSGMGVAVGSVGSVPSVPAGVGLRKK